MDNVDYPSLWQFLGAYLHQDWQEDYAESAEALSDFIVGEPALAPHLVPEIDRLLAATQNSRQTEAALLQLGSFYVPSARGQDPRQWLAHIRTQAAEALPAE